MKSVAAKTKPAQPATAPPAPIAERLDAIREDVNAAGLRAALIGMAVTGANADGPTAATGDVLSHEMGELEAMIYEAADLLERLGAEIRKDGAA